MLPICPQDSDALAAKLSDTSLLTVSTTSHSLLPDSAAWHPGNGRGNDLQKSKSANRSGFSTNLSQAFADGSALNKTLEVQSRQTDTDPEQFVTAAEYLDCTLVNEKEPDQSSSENALGSQATLLADVGAALGAAVRGFVQKVTKSFRSGTNSWSI